jgi:DNA-binding PadR family transcriptional regulator
MPEQVHHLGSRSPEYALLGFLYDQPNHGYNLHQHLVTELGFVWHVSQSQTYAILKRLEKQGYIVSTKLKQEKLPARQLLHITATGRHRFEDWIEKTSANSVRAIRLEFITRLFFAEKHFSDKVPTIITTQLSEINAALTRLEELQSTIPLPQIFNRLSLDLRIRQLQSIRDWVKECHKIFE